MTTNQGDIAAEVTARQALAVTVGQNQTASAANTTGVAGNVTNIASNTTNIGTNATAITALTATVATVQTDVGDLQNHQMPLSFTNVAIPDATQVMKFIANEGFNFLLASAKGTANTAPSGGTGVWSLRKNGIQFGTVTFPDAGNYSCICWVGIRGIRS